jgi:hypothetical protein
MIQQLNHFRTNQIPANAFSWWRTSMGEDGATFVHKVKNRWLAV